MSGQYVVIRPIFTLAQMLELSGSHIVKKMKWSRDHVLT
jgi:hypothetical protein